MYRVECTKDALRTHLRSDHSCEHIQRLPGPNVTTFSKQFVRQCVLGHIEGRPTQLTSSVKQEEEEEATTTDRIDYPQSAVNCPPVLRLFRKDVYMTSEMAFDPGDMSAGDILNIVIQSGLTSCLMFLIQQ